MSRVKKTFITVVSIFAIIALLGGLSALFAPSSSGGDYRPAYTTKAPVYKEWSSTVLEGVTDSFRTRFSYVDGDRVIIGGVNGKMFVTNDGLSFQGVSTPFSSSTTLVDFLRVDDRYYVVSYHDGIYCCNLQFEDWICLDSTTELEAIAYGDGQFLAVGGGHIRYSADGGTSWVDVSTSAYIYDVCYANGQFLYIGQSRALCTVNVSDATPYEEIVKEKAAPVNAIRHISYIDGYYYVAGAQGALSLSRSADLQTWEQVLHVEPGENSTYVRDLCFFDGDLFLVGYTSAGAGFVYRSADKGATWRAVDTFEFKRVWTVAVYRNALYMFGDNRSVYCYK